ncbi:MAG: HD domain-containing protein [Gemmatimonadaceae bacterium]|jgi:3'-5' exoribonuclease|nr:HD domain-containing protein [Gemmatimonadaceae bacterium]
MTNTRFPCDTTPTRIGESAQGTVVVASIDRRTTKDGKPYAVIGLANALGKTTVRVWSDRLDEWRDVGVGTPLHVRCSAVSSFPDGLAWSVDDLAILAATHPVAEESVPPCPVSAERLYDRTRALLERCSPAALALLHVLLHTALEWGDGLRETIANRWRRWPAAVGHHHAVRHGLWWHSVQVTEGALALASVLDGDGPVSLNTDVVVLGGLLHDAGKIDELRAGGGIGDAGRLATHILWGAVRLKEALTRAEHAGFVMTPEQGTLFDDVMHVVASHHNLAEWGSNVRPASREAWLLHAADLASAHVEKGAQAARSGTRVAEHWVQPVGGWARDAVRITPVASDRCAPDAVLPTIACLVADDVPPAPPPVVTAAPPSGQDTLLSLLVPFPSDAETRA